MNGTSPALMLRNVKKSYPRAEALKGIELALPKGEIWGLLGPNGSGKSTLLKCIVGLVKPDAGEIEIDGNPRSRCTKGQIAFVPEMDTLYRWMTVGQTLALYHLHILEATRLVNIS